MEGSTPPDSGDDEEWLRAFAESAGVPLEVAQDVDESDSDDEEVLSVTNRFGIYEVLKSVGDAVEPVVVGGRFRLIRRVGTGSYGTVYEAEDGELGRRVAVKVMPLGDPEVADREGKALAAIEHDNIVQIFDHGREDDYRWLVLEFIDGPTLGLWCEGKSSKEILARFLEAGEGLDAAHRRGLIHRDFKPGNVMINAKGRAVVTDFGLARNLESLNDRPVEEESLLGSGTFGFLSPERLQGGPGDEKSDQFAFCVSLWWALTGAHPFAIEGKLEDYFASMRQAPRNRRKLGRRTRKALERGMAPLPGDRWRTMTALLDALREAQAPRAGWIGGVLTIVALSIGAPWYLAWSAPSLPTKSVSLPETEQALLLLVSALEQEDVGLAVNALKAGADAARADGREAEYISAASVAAVELEAMGEDEGAIYAWSMVLELSRELGDVEMMERAREGRRAVALKFSQ